MRVGSVESIRGGSISGDAGTVAQEAFRAGLHFLFSRLWSSLVCLPMAPTVRVHSRDGAPGRLPQTLSSYTLISLRPWAWGGGAKQPGPHPCMMVSPESSEALTQILGLLTTATRCWLTLRVGGWTWGPGLRAPLVLPEVRGQPAMRRGPASPRPAG